MRFARALRRPKVVGLVIAVVLVGVALACAPAIGRWYIKRRVLPSLGRSLSRTVSVGRVSVGLSRVRLQQLTVSGPLDQEAPLASVPEVTVDFAPTSVLFGPLEVERVLVEHPRLNLVRMDGGKSNFLDLLRRKGGGKGKGKGRLRVQAVEVRAGSFALEDLAEKVRVEVGAVAGELFPGGASAVRLGAVRITSPRVRSAVLVSKVEVALRGRAVQQVTVGGGEVQLLPMLRLTAIRGTVKPDSASRRTRIELSGSYGGAEAKLWSASGWLAADRSHGEVRIRAARFSLGRIASILGPTPVILPQNTLIDGQLDLTYRQRVLGFAGKLDVERLSLFHPRLALTPVLELSGSAVLDGKLDLAAEQLQLETLVLRSRGVEVQLSGSVQGIGTEPQVALRLVVPKIPCQKVLEAFPPSLLPSLQGFVLKGDFFVDLNNQIDYRDLDKVVLQGKVGIKGCKVVEAPEAMSAERLKGQFEQHVEPTPNQYVVFVVGPENEDFAPFAKISPNVINAFLTTEDGGFFRHRGFIYSMFARALSRNLKRGGFRLGASTISMQMVKNVLLTHEKTLSRKLQELFLTWYLEQELSKERIMEIYLNVIEFGPGIYGIGRATRHYFGKLPSEVSPLEASFFASILPSPKRRYVQYCHGQPSEKWDRYVRRILARMAGKGFVSEQQMAELAGQSLTFNRNMEELPEEDCVEQVKELTEGWLEERERRLRDAILQAAPHQVELFLPKEPKAPPKRR